MLFCCSVHTFSRTFFLEFSCVIKETIESWTCQYIINDVITATVFTSEGLPKRIATLSPVTLDVLVLGRASYRLLIPGEFYQQNIGQNLEMKHIEQTLEFLENIF